MLEDFSCPLCANMIGMVLVVLKCKNLHLMILVGKNDVESSSFYVVFFLEEYVKEKYVFVDDLCCVWFQQSRYWEVYVSE